MKQAQNTKKGNKQPILTNKDKEQRPSTLSNPNKKVQFCNLDQTSDSRGDTTHLNIQDISLSLSKDYESMIDDKQSDFSQLVMDNRGAGLERKDLEEGQLTED